MQFDLSKLIEIPSFPVIGKEGSTADGEGFVQRLWQQAWDGVDALDGLVRRSPEGFYDPWGCMTDFSRSFAPWENGFSEGRYLAGFAALPGAEAPEGWQRWTLPGFVYCRAPNVAPDAFAEAVAALEAAGYRLAGAGQDHADPATGTDWLYLPLRRL